tara:strand:- start:740 stop:961 length:222 start_codon:yes stop_codon:yes gene_type:complete
VITFFIIEFWFVLYYLNNLDKRLIKNNTIKIKNKIFAMLSAPEAIPPNPNIAAIIAMTINITVQRNIIFDFFG